VEVHVKEQGSMLMYLWYEPPPAMLKVDRREGCATEFESRRPPYPQARMTARPTARRRARRHSHQAEDTKCTKFLGLTPQER
jgi:hypothetical protein